MSPLNVHEMVSSTKLGELLDAHAETESLDFKLIMPQNKSGRAELARDIAAMANTHGGSIVFGVRDETWEPIGLDTTTDPVKIQQALSGIFRTKPQFEYAEHDIERPEWGGKRRFGLLFVQQASVPILLAQTHNEKGGHITSPTTIYIRDGASTASANQDYYNRLVARLGSDRRLHPRRRRHVVLFLAVLTAGSAAAVAVASLLGARSRESSFADIEVPTGRLPSCKAGNAPPELVCAGAWTLIYSTPGGPCTTEGMPGLQGASHHRPVSEIRRLAQQSTSVMVSDLTGNLSLLKTSPKVRRVVSTSPRPIENLRAGRSVSAGFQLSHWKGNTEFLKGVPPDDEALPIIWHSANCRSCLHIVPTASGRGSTDSKACLSRWSFHGPDSPIAVWVR